MRKYRGKRKDNGEEVRGWLFVCKYDKKHYIISDQYTAQELSYSSDLFDKKIAWHEVDPATVGQSTGLTDKERSRFFPKGKEIYEGDIIQWHSLKLEIYWGEHARFMMGKDNITMADAEYSEVIGTIHDDPPNC